MDHVSIVHRCYADLIASGEKRVEARLSRVRAVPIGRVAKGDRIYFRESGGGYRALAEVTKVLCFHELNPSGIGALRRQYEPLVCAGAKFWLNHAGSRHAMFIWLGGVVEVSTGPELSRKPGDRRAWFMLDRRAAA